MKWFGWAFCICVCLIYCDCYVFIGKVYLVISLFHWVSLSQVIGNASALTQSEDWAALLADAKDRGCFISSTTCIQRGLLPEPILGSLGAPLGSPSFRPGGPLSRGRGMGGPHGGRHSSSGNSITSNAVRQSLLVDDEVC